MHQPDRLGRRTALLQRESSRDSLGGGGMELCMCVCVCVCARACICMPYISEPVWEKGTFRAKNEFLISGTRG